MGTRIVATNRNLQGTKNMLYRAVLGSAFGYFFFCFTVAMVFNGNSVIAASSFLQAASLQESYYLPYLAICVLVGAIAGFSWHKLR